MSRCGRSSWRRRRPRVARAHHGSHGGSRVPAGPFHGRSPLPDAALVRRWSRCDASDRTLGWVQDRGQFDRVIRRVRRSRRRQWRQHPRARTQRRRSDTRSLISAVSVRLRCIRRLAPAPAADVELPGGGVPSYQVRSPVHTRRSSDGGDRCGVRHRARGPQPSAWAATGRSSSLGVRRMGVPLCLHCIGSESRYAGSMDPGFVPHLVSGGARRVRPSRAADGCCASVASSSRRS